MIIKTFVGESSAAALKKVRAELGGDAVVLATRRVANTSGGHDTEVTACLDRPAPATTASANQSVVGTRRITKPTWNRMVTKPSPKNANTNVTNTAIKSSAITTADANADLLLALDIPTSVINAITDAISNAGTVYGELSNQIASRMGAAPRFKAGDRVLVLGPNGSGKTSVISKLAAQLTTNKLVVTLTGFQQQKIGAIDELQSIADLVGIEFVDDSMTSDTNQSSVTLIDCGTLNLNAEDIATLNPTHTLFIVPATMRSADLKESVSRFDGIAVSGICMTMLDLTHRLGSLFAVCDTLNAPLALVSTSAFGADSLISPNAESLAQRMLGKGEKNA